MRACVLLAEIFRFSIERRNMSQLDALPTFASPISTSLENGVARVTICKSINLTMAPTDFPFFDDLIPSSSCDVNTHHVELSRLVSMLVNETPEVHWIQPAGFLIHAMRVGSTAAANMAGAPSNAVVIKEPSVITEILSWHGGWQGGESRQRRRQQQVAVQALRAIAHLFFRSAASQRLTEWANRGLYTRQDAQQRAGRTQVVFKLASSGTATAAQLRLLRAAFPDVPFAYVVRDPKASVASLVAPSQKSHELLNAPCLRWRSRPASAQLPSLLERAGATHPLELTVEQYCAAHLGAMHEGMLAQIEADGGLSDPRQRTLVIDHSALPGAVAGEILPFFSFQVDTWTRARALQYGSVNAKNARLKSYDSKTPSAAAGRWATAYAGVTYSRLLALTSSHRAAGPEAAAVSLANAERAAIAARADESVGAGRFAHTAGLSGMSTTRQCERAEEEDNFIEVSEHGMELFRQGDLLGGEACWLQALQMAFDHTREEQMVEVFQRRVSSILQNLATLEGTLSREERMRVTIAPAVASTDTLRSTPQTLVEARRLHGKAVQAGLSQVIVQETRGILNELADPAIGVYDGALSPELCDAIVKLFDGPGSSEHFTGNVGTGTGFEISPDSKLDTEIDISHSPRPLWDGVEFSLLQALLGGLNTYAASNLGLNPPFMWSDEGFRLKKYNKPTPGSLPHHHTWHADAGGPLETACRGVAVIFYFNDVQFGGETVFMSPRPAQVAPRKGRLLIFPASFAYVHSGAQPISDAKYIATTFASACAPVDSIYMPPFPILPVERRHVLRRRWKRLPSHPDHPALPCTQVKEIEQASLPSQPPRPSLLRR